MSTEGRSKMISFRLSSREYKQFRDFRLARGSRSLSELARTAVNRLVTDPSFGVENMLEARINDLEGQLHMLSLELKRLKQAATPELLAPMAHSKGVP